jgi:hypothetical protein
VQGSRLPAAMQFTIVRGLVSNPRLLTLVAETLTYPRKNARQKEPTLRCGLPGNRARLGH